MDRQTYRQTYRQTNGRQQSKHICDSAICVYLLNNIQDVVEALHLALQQTLLGSCPSQLLLKGQSLPSGPDLVPLQQRQAALSSRVTSACAHVMVSQ